MSIKVKRNKKGKSFMERARSFSMDKIFSIVVYCFTAYAAFFWYAELSGANDKKPNSPMTEPVISTVMKTDVRKIAIVPMENKPVATRRDAEEQRPEELPASSVFRGFDPVTSVFGIQTGYFSDKKNADRELTRLHTMGMNPVVREISVNGSPRYRTVIPAGKTEEDRKKTEDSARSSGVMDFIVVNM